MDEEHVDREGGRQQYLIAGACERGKILGNVDALGRAHDFLKDAKGKTGLLENNVSPNVLTTSVPASHVLSERPANVATGVMTHDINGDVAGIVINQLNVDCVVSVLTNIIRQREILTTGSTQLRRLDGCQRLGHRQEVFVARIFVVILFSDHCLSPLANLLLNGLDFGVDFPGLLSPPARRALVNQLQKGVVVALVLHRPDALGLHLLAPTINHLLGGFRDYGCLMCTATNAVINLLPADDKGLVVTEGVQLQRDVGRGLCRRIWILGGEKANKKVIHFLLKRLDFCLGCRKVRMLGHVEDDQGGIFHSWLRAWAEAKADDVAHCAEIPVAGYCKRCHVRG